MVLLDFELAHRRIQFPPPLFHQSPLLPLGRLREDEGQCYWGFLRDLVSPRGGSRGIGIEPGGGERLILSSIQGPVPRGFAEGDTVSSEAACVMGWLPLPASAIPLRDLPRPRSKAGLPFRVN